RGPPSYWNGFMSGISRARRWRSEHGRRGTRGPRLAVEELESRVVPSVYDGSFQAIHLTDLRNDPTLSSITGKGVGIANLDSGVYGANGDIQPNLLAWYDAVGTANGNASGTASDPEG